MVATRELGTVLTVGCQAVNWQAGRPLFYSSRDLLKLACLL